MKTHSLRFALLAGLAASSAVAQQSAKESAPAYEAELNIIYCKVGGKELKLNAFLPGDATNPAPAIVEIHGGWWHGLDMSPGIGAVGGHQIFIRRRLAVFSIQYRLGEEGGFPQNIRDCRNAIRFIRLNAKRFHMDPERIDVTGGSAGGHLSLMVAMVPEDFDDGGPTPGLEGVSARVSGCFGFVPPTDFVRFWNEGPGDEITNADGKTTFRGPDNRIPNDARPRFRVLFHGVTPDTEGHKALYNRMCPLGWVRKNIPPLLICDGEKDPIVPGLEGKELYEQLAAVGADATYWMTRNGGHGFPGGTGFQKILDDFLVRTLNLGTAR